MSKKSNLYLYFFIIDLNMFQKALRVYKVLPDAQRSFFSIVSNRIESGEAAASVCRVICEKKQRKQVVKQKIRIILL